MALCDVVERNSDRLVKELGGETRMVPLPNSAWRLKTGARLEVPLTLASRSLAVTRYRERMEVLYTERKSASQDEGAFERMAVCGRLLEDIVECVGDEYHQSIFFVAAVIEAVRLESPDLRVQSGFYAGSTFVTLKNGTLDSLGTFAQRLHEAYPLVKAFYSNSHPPNL